MAHELGGDYFQQIKVSDDLELISCFDVSGKNIAASLSTSMIGTFFSTLKMTGILKLFTPEKLVLGLNKLIYGQVPEEMFIAGIFIFINKKQKQIEIFNLGYCRMFFLFRDNDKISYKTFEPRLKPLGIEPNLDFEKDKEIIPIRSQSEIFIYSDGLVDARNKFGETYGENNLEEFLSKRTDLDPDLLIKELNSRIAQFVGNAPQADDITVLVIKFN
jgi:phosphoserine phosphatase RsbU/P